MKIWESEHTFHHPWETVAQAAWRKYPNPKSTAVKSADVTERRVRDDGVLVSSRLLATEWNIPNWVSSLIGLRNPSYGFEYSEVDPLEKKMTLRSSNVNCRRFVSMDETLVYDEDPADPSRTRLRQSTAIRVFGIPFVDYCEDLMAKAASSNASVGREGLEWVIDGLKTEWLQLETRLSSELHHINSRIGDFKLKPAADLAGDSQPQTL